MSILDQQAVRRLSLVSTMPFTFKTEVEVAVVEPQLVVAGMEPAEFTNVFPVWMPRPDVTAIQEKVCYDLLHHDACNGDLLLSLVGR